MAQPGSLAHCADVAARIAQQRQSAEWLMLSELMCWDAVAHLALLAGVLDEAGQGWAAGNKNGCLQKAGGGDIGSPIGWEVVDLRYLARASGRPCLRQDTQDIEVRHRPLTALASA